MVDVEKCGVGEKEEMGDKQTEMKTNQFINQSIKKSHIIIHLMSLYFLSL